MRILSFIIAALFATYAHADTAMTYNNMYTEYPTGCAFSENVIRCFDNNGELAGMAQWENVGKSSKFTQKRQGAMANDPKWREEVRRSMNVRMIDFIQEFGATNFYMDDTHVIRNNHGVYMTIGISTLETERGDTIMYLIQIWDGGYLGELMLLMANNLTNRSQAEKIIHNFRRK